MNGQLSPLWPTQALIVMLALIVVIASIIIKWGRGNLLASLSGGAIIGFIIFWAVMGTIPLFLDHLAAGFLTSSLAFGAGALLVLAATMLSVSEATRMRRWLWVVLLGLAMLPPWLSSICFAKIPAASCALLPPSAEPCATSDRYLTMGLIALTMIWPVTLLIYALHTQRRASLAQTSPEVALISRLDGNYQSNQRDGQ